MPSKKLLTIKESHTTHWHSTAVINDGDNLDNRGCNYYPTVLSAQDTLFIFIE